MGFESCELGFGKKMNWEMGLVPPPPVPFRTLSRVRIVIIVAVSSL